MEANRRIRALISGKVQGVFYRAATQEVAARLGLTGWVKNLFDGRVELIAEGSNQAVSDLIKWCHHGPSYAKVTEVKIIEEIQTGEFSDFSVRY